MVLYNIRLLRTIAFCVVMRAFSFGSMMLGVRKCCPERQSWRGARDWACLATRLEALQG